MSTPAAKAEQPKAPAPVDRSAPLQSSSRAFSTSSDNRPVAAAQQQQQTLISNSSRMQRAAAQQALIAQSPRQHAAQLRAMAPNASTAAPAKRNTTGLPDQLKAGVENLSGYSLDDVQVHYNSAKPAQLQAHAYAQGSDIHVAPGQEQHLPHEAWHVVQQKQGRVRATTQLKGVGVNDAHGLEQEADIMGQQALRATGTGSDTAASKSIMCKAYSGVVQARFVHFHSTPPMAGQSDGTWSVQSAQIDGVRPPFYQDTMDAVDARQPDLSYQPQQAVRHINPWGGMISYVERIANGGHNTIAQVAQDLNNRWPASSVVPNPGIPAPLENDSVATYAEQWLDASHNDPKNLFWGNGPENSGLGDRYDNPTKAKGLAGTSKGGAFSAAEKQGLVSQQITALTGAHAGDSLSEGQLTIFVAAWLTPHLARIDQGNRTFWRTNFTNRGNTYNKLVAFLAKNTVFPHLELDQVFRTDQSVNGPVA